MYIFLFLLNYSINSYKSSKFFVDTADIIYSSSSFNYVISNKY